MNHLHNYAEENAWFLNCKFFNRSLSNLGFSSTFTLVLSRRTRLIIEASGVGDHFLSLRVAVPSPRQGETEAR